MSDPAVPIAAPQRPVRLVRISSPTGRIDVRAGNERQVVVDGDATVARDGSTVTVSGVRSQLTVFVPAGVDVAIGAESGRVTTRGRLGAVSVVARSGRVDVDAAAAVEVRADSGRVTVGSVDGPVRLRAGSGAVRVAACGSADVATESGSIGIADVRGPVRAHCVSGKIDIALSQPADVDAETVSGRIKVTVPKGTRVHRSERPGEPRPPDTDCQVVARSVSGRIVVRS